MVFNIRPVVCAFRKELSNTILFLTVGLSIHQLLNSEKFYFALEHWDHFEFTKEFS